MIYELLAACGGSFEQYALVAGQLYSDPAGAYYKGYTAGSYGTLTPATFRTKTIKELSTIDFGSGQFNFMLGSVDDGKPFWTRIEFIYNNTIEKTIYIDQAAYTTGINGDSEIWTAVGTGYDMVAARAYTVRIYY